jgi:hypothetical protein
MIGEPPLPGTGDAKTTLILSSEVTVESDTGVSDGLSGTEAFVMKPT